MQEIKLENLDDGPGVLPFKLGPANIISNYHSFLQYVNFDDLQSKINSLNSQLTTISPDLDNSTSSLFEPHVSYLKNKLKTLSNQLLTFESNRVKRGLIDGLGSAIKSITGNLDHTDALHFNNAIKNIQNKENAIISELNNHVSITKEWTSQYSKIIDNIISNQNKIETIIAKIRKSVATNDNDLIKYAHLAQVFLILSDNVDLLSLEITKLENNLAFIRTSSMHHSVISPDSIRDIVNKMKSLYGKENIIDLDTREYYDIIKLGSYYTDNSIVIVYKFPVTLPQTYNLFKLSIVPNKYNEILTPSSPFLAIHSKDFKYIEAECPKTSKGYLCEEMRNLRSRTSPDCIHQLIITQQRGTVCHPLSIQLENPAFEELDDRHYTVSFPKPTKVHLSCGQDLHQILQGSYLLILPHKCFIETPEFLITNTKDRIKGQAMKIMDLPKTSSTPTTKALPFKLTSINLDHLHATSSKIAMQNPMESITLTDYSLYHTTIPMYVLFGACVIIMATIIYRKYMLQKKDNPDESLKPQHQIPRIYAVPVASRSLSSDAAQPPAQFTTRVFNTRCTTGGGVTQP